MRRDVSHWCLRCVLGLVLGSLSTSPIRANTFSNDPEVVRIQGSNPASGGTGTLIGMRQVQTKLGLVFFAADHTMERIGPLTTIGFGNLSSPTLNLAISPSMNPQIVTKGPDGTEDLAVIGVTIDLSTLSAGDASFLESLTPIGVGFPPTSFVPFEISVTGFGKFGSNTTYGTQASFDNEVDSYFTLNAGSYTTDQNNNPLVYTQAMLSWTYNDPGTGDWVPGEGAGYGGYSGSAVIDLNGTGNIQGIQASGSDLVNGAQSIGVRLIPAYVSWIGTQSNAYLLPEPAVGSGVTYAFPVLALLQRRLRRSRRDR